MFRRYLRILKERTTLRVRWVASEVYEIGAMTVQSEDTGRSPGLSYISIEHASRTATGRVRYTSDLHFG